MAGKTFTSSAGVGLTGTMVNRGTLNWNPTSNTTQTVQPGYYSGGTLNSAGAYNKGKTDGATQSKVGTAAPGQVLAGKTFTNSSTVGATGTMVNNGAWTNTPTAKGKITIPAGYHNGSGYVDTTSVYNKGMQDADARVNVNSESYKKAPRDRVTSVIVTGQSVGFDLYFEINGQRVSSTRKDNDGIYSILSLNVTDKLKAVDTLENAEIILDTAAGEVKLLINNVVFKTQYFNNGGVYTDNHCDVTDLLKFFF